MTSDGVYASSLYRVPRALTDPKPPACYNSINLCKEENPFSFSKDNKSNTNLNEARIIIKTKYLATAKNEYSAIITHHELKNAKASNLCNGEPGVWLATQKLY